MASKKGSKKPAMPMHKMPGGGHMMSDAAMKKNMGAKKPMKRGR